MLLADVHMKEIMLSCYYKLQGGVSRCVYTLITLHTYRYVVKVVRGINANTPIDGKRSVITEYLGKSMKSGHKSQLDSKCSYDDLLDAFEYGARRLANLSVDMLNNREQMGDTPERAWLNTHILLCKMARVRFININMILIMQLSGTYLRLHRSHVYRFTFNDCR